MNDFCSPDTACDITCFNFISGKEISDPSNGSKQRYRNPHAMSKGKHQTRSCRTCNIQRAAVCHQPAHLVEECTSDALRIN